MTSFARALNRARKEHGWSQEYLAADLAVSQATVSFWERGVEYPSLEHLAGLVGLMPEVLLYAHEEELDLIRRLMWAERLAFGGGCSCQGCGCS